MQLNKCDRLFMFDFSSIPMSISPYTFVILNKSYVRTCWWEFENYQESVIQKENNHDE